jgi:hypothetical protein
MPNAGRRTRLAQKPTASRFVADISLVDHLQGYGTSEIDIERLVSNPHTTTTQLDRFASLVQDHFIVLESANLRPGATFITAGCR